MISILMPSRLRSNQFFKSVASLYTLAENPQDLEVLVAADPDDIETQANARMCNLPLFVAPERFGYSRLYEYYNALAKQSNGDFLLLWNDDAVMTTPGWDAKIEAAEDDALVVDVQSNLSPRFVCFPAMRREMYEVLGHYSTETPHIDSYIQDIARELGRVRPVDVFVQHDRPDLVDGMHDSTFLEGRDGLRHEAYFDPNGPVQGSIAQAIEAIRGAGI